MKLAIGDLVVCVDDGELGLIKSVEPDSIYPYYVYWPYKKTSWFMNGWHMAQELKKIS